MRPAAGIEPELCHFHYRLQASWLSAGRRQLFRRAQLAHCRSVLDLGCGTGVLTAEASAIAAGEVLGVDRDDRLIEFARLAYPQCRFAVGDERKLRRLDRRFDLVFMAFVLLWQPDPLRFLRAIRRLLLPQGRLLLLAEPDYSGRRDWPAAIASIKDVYVRHIRAAGGDPDVGRRLPDLLRQARFRAQAGVYGESQAVGAIEREVFEREWEFWRRLARLSDAEWRKWKNADWQAIRSGTRRVLFPIHYAVAFTDG